jgi:glycosyltransferase involved in cell wall biosynthesis
VIVENSEISIVVCTYNRAAILSRALDTLERQQTNGKFTYDIIIVDDGSSDHTTRVVRDFAERRTVPVKYVAAGGQGIAHARNCGIDATNSPWIAFFDDDQLAEPNWLLELYRCALEHGAVCVGGIRRLALTQRELTGLSSASRQVLGEIDYGNKTQRCGRKAIPAAGNQLISRSLLDEVGHFDGELVRGGEDIEIAHRIRSAGYEAWFTPMAIVYHITPPYRLKTQYLLWASLRGGVCFAYRDILELGLKIAVLGCFARMAQAMAINAPLLLIAVFAHQKAQITGRKCLLARACGYAAHTFHQAAPSFFNFDRFFDRLEFRKERKIFSNTDT